MPTQFLILPCHCILLLGRDRYLAICLTYLLSCTTHKLRADYIVGFNGSPGYLQMPLLLCITSENLDFFHISGLRECASLPANAVAFFLDQVDIYKHEMWHGIFLWLSVTTACRWKRVARAEFEFKPRSDWCSEGPPHTTRPSRPEL